MTQQLQIPAEGVSGSLRAGAESAVRSSNPDGHVHGKLIVIESITINYQLKDRTVPGAFIDPAGGC